MADPSTDDPISGPAPRKRRVGLIIGIIAAVVVLFGAFSSVEIYLYERNVNGPAHAVDAWNSASYSGDQATLKSLTCAKERDIINIYPIDNSAQYSWKITAVDTAGDTSTVTVDYTWTQDGQQKSLTSFKLPVVKENGSWKVCPDFTGE
jgi:hypothetical protein